LQCIITSDVVELPFLDNTAFSAQASLKWLLLYLSVTDKASCETIEFASWVFVAIFCILKCHNECIACSYLPIITLYTEHSKKLLECILPRICTESN